jgi:predicted TIM-barrel fold metal-dependent hydrolase
MIPSGKFPAGSCDCHAHIFGPQSRYAYAAGRRYTPDDALLPAYRVMLASHGIDRAVLIQPSVYGTDNRAMLDALSEAGPEIRGIAMVDESVADAELLRFHRMGVRGVRTQIKPDGSGKPLDLGGIRRIAERTRSLGWHVEIHVDVGKMQDVETPFSDYPVPVVIEHMGHMPTATGIEAPGFQSLLRFINGEIGWVKLSGPYINSAVPAPYADVRPFVEALVTAAPSRTVWGINWPHPHRDPIPDDDVLCGLVWDWLPTAELRWKVLVDNPARLYDFERVASETSSTT